MNHLSIKRLPKGNMPSRIIVPTAVSKSAVARNKLKRRVREILRSEKATNGLSIYFRKGGENLKFQELKKEITKTIKFKK